MYNFEEKVVLVTGSSKGIGREIARRFSLSGAKVVLNSRNDDIKEVEKEINNSFAIQGDMTLENEAKRIEQVIRNKYGQLDHLICNIGKSKSAKRGSEQLDDWKEMMSINLYATVNAVSSFKELLSKNKGSVVCISSICGEKIIEGAPATYSVAKCALNSYIENYARHLGDLGIRINGITPGNILVTEGLWAKKLEIDTNKVLDMLEKNVPLRQLGSAGDVATMCLHLASEHSKFVTGAIWRVDGGQVVG